MITNGVVIVRQSKAASFINRNSERCCERRQNRDDVRSVRDWTKRCFIAHFIEVEVASGIWWAEVTLIMMKNKILDECVGGKTGEEHVWEKIDDIDEEWGSAVVPRL